MPLLVESTNFEMCRYNVSSVSRLSSENSVGSVSSFSAVLPPCMMAFLQILCDDETVA